MIAGKSLEIAKFDTKIQGIVHDIRANYKIILHTSEHPWPIQRFYRNRLKLARGIRKEKKGVDPKGNIAGQKFSEDE